ncbi:Heterokaryon incompatibility protein (HET) domain containing protein [Hyaloscypha variabilis]
MASPHPTLYLALEPAGGIRILVLEPGSKDSRICCQLILENIASSPEYKALSYEWGAVEDPKDIELNGQIVSVRQNLWWALWYLRDEYLEARLWIDALCINQEDAIERGHQVAMMGSIYRNAEVICWLGSGHRDSKLTRAMEILIQVGEGRISQSSEEAPTSQGKLENLEKPMAEPTFRLSQGSFLTSNDLAKLFQNYYDVLGSERRLYGDNTLPKTGTSSIAYHNPIYSESHNKISLSSLSQDVEALCSLSYWRRTWIIQEVVLGKRIQIRLGNSSIDGENFATASKICLLAAINEESLLMVDGFRMLSLRRSWFRGQKLTLLKLMEFSERSSCQNLRDRVYAMIGLASDCQYGQIVPDYEKSLSDVLSDIVLDHFYPMEVDKSGDSWQLVHSSQLVQRAFWGVSGSLSERESLLLRPQSSTEVLGRCMLKIAGVHCGTVFSTNNPEPGSIWWAHPGLIKSFLPESSQNHVLPSPLSRLVQAIWSPLSKLWHGVSLEARHSDISNETVPIQKLSVVVPEEDEIIHVYGPSSANLGDVICRFINSDVVAVLRPVRGSYVLVGRAMILDEDEDVSVFHEGFEPTPSMLRTGMLSIFPRETIIRLKVTPAALQKLTSPHY